MSLFTELSADRMVAMEVKGRIIWEPWVDLPEYIMAKESAWREWNQRMRLRDEANRSKIDEEFDRLQKALET